MWCCEATRTTSFSIHSSRGIVKGSNSVAAWFGHSAWFEDHLYLGDLVVPGITEKIHKAMYVDAYGLCLGWSEGWQANFQTYLRCQVLSTQPPVRGARMMEMPGMIDNVRTFAWLPEWRHRSIFSDCEEVILLTFIYVWHWVEDQRMTCHMPRKARVLTWEGI